MKKFAAKFELFANVFNLHSINYKQLGTTVIIGHIKLRILII